MHLSPEDLRALHNVACTVAREAGQVIQEAASVEIEVGYKETGGSLATQVVTEVDLKCDALIREGLQQSIERYDLALLTEETEDDGARLEKDYFWCVDPLDGTLAFTRNVPGYSVAISLISKQGDPVIGVVYDPVLQNLYTAIVGQGAWLNGEPWRPDWSSPTSQNELNIQLDCSFVESEEFEQTWALIERWARGKGFTGINRFTDAGGVLSAIEALRSPPATYFKPPRVKTGGGSAWDFAATACIYNELGAYARDFSGSPFFFNPPGSTYMHHCGVMFASSDDIAELAEYLGNQKR